MRVLFWLLIGVLPLAAQRSGVDTTSGGIGPVTPTTFAAHVARNTVDFGPLPLQALVLWHGETNWFTDDWTRDEKGIHTPTRTIEYTFNGDSVTIDGLKVSLRGINVILVEVEPTRTRVVETLYIEESIPVRNTEDPIRAILRRHPRLAEFAELEP
jgi:hypothetical protein